MALNSFGELNDMQKSVLQEISNMGAGNAATAVSQMISSPTDISTPQVKINPAALAGRVADMLSRDAEAYLIKLCGDMRGAVLFTFPYPYIERLAGTFFPDTSVKCADDLNDMTSSIVRETVNIAAAAYANSFALMSGLTVDISVPESVEAPSQAILDTAGGSGTVPVCFVSNSIEISDCHKAFSVLFYPELETIKSFMGKIGVEC